MSDLLSEWWCKGYGWLRSYSHRTREAGSVTMENVIWALAVIAIAAIVVAAITVYVTNHSNQLIGS
ncbi:MAG: hypothetical protein FWF43_04990 [Propionibacteriaceae bacterium]|nr:hypothetical protein [Propionibacteriaceae bacterium]